MKKFRNWVYWCLRFKKLLPWVVGCMSRQEYEAMIQQGKSMLQKSQNSENMSGIEK